MFNYHNTRVFTGVGDLSWQFEISRSPIESNTHLSFSEEDKLLALDIVEVQCAAFQNTREGGASHGSSHLSICQNCSANHLFICRRKIDTFGTIYIERHDHSTLHIEH